MQFRVNCSQRWVSWAKLSNRLHVAEPPCSSTPFFLPQHAQSPVEVWGASWLVLQLQIGQSKFETQPGMQCCVLGQDSVQMGTSKFNAGGNQVMNQHPIQRGSRNAPSCLQKPETSCSPMGHLAPMQSFIYAVPTTLLVD